MKIPAFLKNKDVQGWLLWFGITMILIGPCIFAVYRITYDTASTLTRVVAGVFSAAILAGVVSWLGGEVWYRVRLRQYEARKKTARKAKRKNK